MFRTTIDDGKTMSKPDHKQLLHEVRDTLRIHDFKPELSSADVPATVADVLELRRHVVDALSDIATTLGLDDGQAMLAEIVGAVRALVALRDRQDFDDTSGLYRVQVAMADGYGTEHRTIVTGCPEHQETAAADAAVALAKAADQVLGRFGLELSKTDSAKRGLIAVAQAVGLLPDLVEGAGAALRVNTDDVVNRVRALSTRLEQELETDPAAGLLRELHGLLRRFDGVGEFLAGALPFRVDELFKRWEDDFHTLHAIEQVLGFDERQSRDEMTAAVRRLVEQGPEVAAAMAALRGHLGLAEGATWADIHELVMDAVQVARKRPVVRDLDVSGLLAQLRQDLELPETMSSWGAIREVVRLNAQVAKQYATVPDGLSTTLSILRAELGMTSGSWETLRRRIGEHATFVAGAATALGMGPSRETGPLLDELRALVEMADGVAAALYGGPDAEASTADLLKGVRSLEEARKGSAALAQFRFDVAQAAGLHVNVEPGVVLERVSNLAGELEQARAEVRRVRGALYEVALAAAQDDVAFDATLFRPGTGGLSEETLFALTQRVWASSAELSEWRSLPSSPLKLAIRATHDLDGGDWWKGHPGETTLVSTVLDAHDVQLGTALATLGFGPENWEKVQDAVKAARGQAELVLPRFLWVDFPTVPRPPRGLVQLDVRSPEEAAHRLRTTMKDRSKALADVLQMDGDTAFYALVQAVQEILAAKKANAEELVALDDLVREYATEAEKQNHHPLFGRMGLARAVLGRLAAADAELGKVMDLVSDLDTSAEDVEEVSVGNVVETVTALAEQWSVFGTALDWSAQAVGLTERSGQGPTAVDRITAEVRKAALVVALSRFDTDEVFPASTARPAETVLAVRRVADLVAVPAVDRLYVRVGAGDLWEPHADRPDKGRVAWSTLNKVDLVDASGEVRHTVRRVEQGGEIGFRVVDRSMELAEPGSDAAVVARYAFQEASALAHAVDLNEAARPSVLGPVRS